MEQYLVCDITYAAATRINIYFPDGRKQILVLFSQNYSTIISAININPGISGILFLFDNRDIT